MYGCQTKKTALHSQDGDGKAKRKTMAYRTWNALVSFSKGG